MKNIKDAIQDQLNNKNNIFQTEIDNMQRLKYKLMCIILYIIHSTITMEYSYVRFK